MKVYVDFSRPKDSSNEDDCSLFRDMEDTPMGRLFIGNPQKFEALLDVFERLCTLEHEVHVAYESRADFACIAAGDGPRGMVVLINADSVALEIQLDCHGLSPVEWRIIDEERTDGVVPPMGTLPPISVVVVKTAR